MQTPYKTRFSKWMFLQPKPSDQPFHSPASFNVISIAGIHFAYISCCYVEETLALRSSIIATCCQQRSMRHEI